MWELGWLPVGNYHELLGYSYLTLDKQFCSRCPSVLSVTVPSLYDITTKLSAHSRVLGQHWYLNPQLNNLQQSWFQKDVSHLKSFRIHMCHIIDICFIKPETVFLLVAAFFSRHQENGGKCFDGFYDFSRKWKDFEAVVMFKSSLWATAGTGRSRF